MSYIIINALPNETINDLNINFNLQLVKSLFRGRATLPKVDEFEKYRIMMEANEPVDYDRNTY